MFVNISWGDAMIPQKDVFSILFGKLSENSAWSYIVEERWLRTLNAVISGGALAISGLIIQSFFRNPLAGPGVLGISSGASVGVALAILAGDSLSGWFGFSQYLLGFSGAFLVLMILMILNKWVKGVTLLVIGLMISFFASSFVSLLLNLSDAIQTKKYVEWGFGSFSLVNSDSFYYYMSILLLLMLACVFYFPKLLNAWVYGENQVSTAGYSIKISRLLIILIIGLIVALVTLQCGPISFIGIAVPQVIRMFFKTSHHFVLLVGAFIGGAFIAVLSDIILRNAGFSLPLNAITALFGAPIIILVILRGSKTLQIQ
jgi:iron complex transport system permease protein